MHRVLRPLLSLRSATLTLALLTSIGCTSASSPSQVEKHADRILVVKSQHIMTLFADGKPMATYKVALGKGHGQAKEREGDHETPEGFYIIDAKNAHSRFHRALHISYPRLTSRTANAQKPHGSRPEVRS